MKKPKKSIPEIKEVMVYRYQLQCPHCKTYIRDGFDKDVIQYRCPKCGNSIMIDWNNAISVKEFSI